MKNHYLLDLDTSLKLRREVKEQMKINSGKELKAIRKRIIDEAYELVKGQSFEAYSMQKDVIKVLAMLADSDSVELKKKYNLDHSDLPNTLCRLELFLDVLSNDSERHLFFDFIDVDHIDHETLIKKHGEIIKRKGGVV